MMPDFFMNSYFIRTALFLGEDATGKKINPTATSSKLCLIKFLSNALFFLKSKKLPNSGDNSERMVRGVGFEPTNLCRIGASGLRLWPCWATPA
jgi:hypothetical protein